MQRLGEYLNREVPAQAPLLVAGDFNDWREQLDKPMAQIGLQRAPGGRTFPSRAPLLALDRIYLRGLQAHRFEVLRGGAWPRRSDHLPLLVELGLL